MGSETPRHRGSMSHIQMPSATSWGSKFSLRRLGPHPSFHTGNRFSLTFPVLRSRWFTTISVFGYDPSIRAPRNTLPSSCMSSGVCPPTLCSRSARTARSKDSGSFAHGFHSSRSPTTAHKVRLELLGLPARRSARTPGAVRRAVGSVPPPAPSTLRSYDRVKRRSRFANAAKQVAVAVHEPEKGTEAVVRSILVPTSVEGLPAGYVPDLYHIGKNC